MNSQMKTVGVIALIVVAVGLLFVSLKSTLFASGPAKATPEQGKAMADAVQVGGGPPEVGSYGHARQHQHRRHGRPQGRR